MDKRFNQNIHSEILDVIETTTGRPVSEGERKMIARGADEIDLIRSGLEETMISAYNEIRRIWKENPAIDSLRTAAFVNAIKKISNDYQNLGIFP